jgi:hypothetical protein
MDCCEYGAIRNTLHGLNKGQNKTVHINFFNNYKNFFISDIPRRLVFYEYLFLYSVAPNVIHIL